MAAKPMRAKSKAKPLVKRPVGRPSGYTEQLADHICTEIAIGKSLSRILQENGMPDYSTVSRWLIDRVEFRNKYARAREEQADFMADELVQIADTEPDPQRAKVRIDARKWVASKLKPKKYGDKIDNTISGPDGGPIQQNMTLNVVFVSPTK